MPMRQMAKGDKPVPNISIRGYIHKMRMRQDHRSRQYDFRLKGMERTIHTLTTHPIPPNNRASEANRSEWDDLFLDDIQSLWIGT